MTASIRIVLLTLSVMLLVASCGQKGPLTLPEDDAGAPQLHVQLAASGAAAAPVVRNR